MDIFNPDPGADVYYAQMRGQCNPILCPDAGAYAYYTQMRGQMYTMPRFGTRNCCGTMDIREEVMRLSYKDVRKLLKAAGLRANGKSAALREELTAHRGGIWA